MYFLVLAYCISLQRSTDNVQCQRNKSNLIKPSLCLSHPLLDWEKWPLVMFLADIVRSSRSIVMGNLRFSILCQRCYNLLIQTSNWCSTHLVSPWNLKCFVSVKCGWFLWGSEFPPWARIMPSQRTTLCMLKNYIHGFQPS